MLELGCLLPLLALGLHMAPNEFRISAKYRLGVPVYDAERKGSARFVKQEVLTSMGIMPLRVTVEETQLQDITRFEIK